MPHLYYKTTNSYGSKSPAIGHADTGNCSSRENIRQALRMTAINASHESPSWCDHCSLKRLWPWTWQAHKPRVSPRQIEVLGGRYVLATFCETSFVPTGLAADDGNFFPCKGCKGLFGLRMRRAPVTLTLRWGPPG